MRPSITDNVQDHPGKMRLSFANLVIYVDEVLNLPVGMMFATNDEKTNKPKICVLTYGGVLIEEFESETTPEVLHKMIVAQRENAFNTANMILANENAAEVTKQLKEKMQDERNKDVS